MSDSAFFNELRQDVMIRADVQEAFSESAFTELIAEHLLETGDIDDFTLCPFKQPTMKLDGYALLEDRGILDLFLADYRDLEEPETLTKTELGKLFKKVEAFYSKCQAPGFLNALETSLPVYDLVERIHACKEDITQVRVFLFSNASLSSLIREMPTQVIEDREWSYHVWDLERIERLITSGEPEPITVDFQEMFGRSLPCLPAGEDEQGVQSYLAVIPGDWLAGIYERFSGRLMEQNVRTFLQFKAGINKGIRKTLLETPGLFFSFNNGISATAQEIEVDPHGTRIHRVKNLQIVNGGQTTASIHYSMKKDGAKARLDKVKVQMKLTIVESALVEELVPKISRFANTQNKVSDADFFSNHPFHVRIQGFSRRVWAPPTKGAIHQTHWFYERAKGQFGTEQTHLSVSAKKAFLTENPKSQLITKTDLAKVINTFELMPDRVSSGSQKNFGKFAELIDAEWSKDEKTFSESWFQDAVAKTILFRASERIVQNADWYSKGYRANVVTYGIALLVHKLREDGRLLDLKAIWRAQDISSVLATQIEKICRLVQDRIIRASEENGVRNVTEWCKKPGCWNDIKSLRIPIISTVISETISLADARRLNADGKKDQGLNNDVEMMAKVVEMGNEHWQEVLNWGQLDNRISPNDVKLLSLAASIPKRIPEPYQCERLLEINKMFQDEIHI